jgi:glycerol-3-phosphate dehydrogenase
MKDVIIIGAGVIGGLIARELSRYKVSFLIVDKENDVANGTTMANSAIVHSGYDPMPNTKKAYFNRKSVPLFPKLCEELDVELDNIGSLTVALYEEQLPLLDSLVKRAKENDVEVKLLTKEEVLAIEPNLNPDVLAALYAKDAGIVNPFQLTVHAIENAIDNGGELLLNAEVKSINQKEDHFEVVTSKRTHLAKVVVNAAGVHSDDIAKMVGDNSFEITPRKGSYFVIDKLAEPLVNHVVFPLPKGGSKGILVTPTTTGNILIGPTSEYSSDKTDIGTDAPTLNKIRESALTLVPSIPFNKTIRTFSGLRATPDTGDFIIEESKVAPNFINVAGIESPGLASAPYIGIYVVEELIAKLLPLKEKKNYNPRIKKYTKPKLLNEAEIAELHKKDPRFARMICNCEQVSEGEIVEILSRSVPVNSIKAVKKRLRAGFGKCQGGFCQIHVMKVMADFYKVPLSKIVFDEEDSYIVLDDKDER